MLQSQELTDRIVARFDEMSPQLQKAARYILENGQEVALVSMRELARNARVQPATMTRLAQFLGLGGYEDIRAQYSQALRLQADGFAARAQAREADAPSGSGLAYGMLQMLSSQIARLQAPESLARLERVADRLAGAGRVYVLGLRSCHSVAWHFHYVMTLLGEKTVHLDGPAGTGVDGMRRAGPQDVMLVISVNPYARQTLELVGLAQDKGVGIVALTDSEVSPLARVAEEVVICATESETFFHTLTPALAVSEVLCGLLADRDRDRALRALQEADRHLQGLDTYASDIPTRRG
ncbi:MurR/RpiR family transcriptional regulator [Pseudooceanicola nanhaiensis]|uniref:MurR/RpiR family transcriptional regulator n=1 Tax=Pseudooceanicola nanhaiensis TaxID=375761 RepID=UPI001CD72E08|nr:MurR/RpiR family transcriptional regulator [Pseudooceanicola nanhaiensis]MCA0921549.1 MurR/RpiR family transcriptional regulator [Pseudooceanicola nanhaiensis]